MLGFIYGFFGFLIVTIVGCAMGHVAVHSALMRRIGAGCLILLGGFLAVQSLMRRPFDVADVATLINLALVIRFLGMYVLTGRHPPGFAS